MTYRSAGRLFRWMAASTVSSLVWQTALAQERPASAAGNATSSAEDATTAAPSAAAPNEAESGVLQRRKTGVGLRRCLELAERNYPKVHEARARLEQKRAQSFQARTAPFSEFTLSFAFAPAPVVQGTALYSPSSDLPITSKMSVGWQGSLTGLVPLWTFGKITNLWDAADAQVKVGEQEIRKEKNDLKLQVRRAFYGVLLTRDALTLVDEALSRVDKYAAHLAERLKEGEGDEIDLWRLQIQREDLVVRQSEARKQEQIAMAGLRFFTGVVETATFDVPDRPLQRVNHHLAPLARYLSAARLYRPEVNMARAGVLAREAQLRQQRAGFFPDIGLALGATIVNAPYVTDQRNPFVRDVGHAQSYGASLAVRYKLDFLPQSARYAQARAQLEEQRATERFALGGVGVEVEQAYREAEDAERRLDALTRAVGFAKKWMIAVQQGIDVGTFEDADIVDPAKEYALRRFGQMSATFDYNVAVGKLAQATGWDVIAADD
ncbi:MAG TPA: TolC family protein [Polyangiaceae bacterium]|nr:TolC family protein [Polyangiaceae bacterium]